MIEDTKYKLLSAVESHGGSGSYGVKILVYRPPEAQERFDALTAKEYLKTTSAENAIKYLVPDAESLLNAVRRQDRMLDPVVKQSEKDTKSSIAKAFSQPGGLIFMEAIPNGYWRPTDPWSVGDPWYRVATSVGHFVVGWRKRVLHLDWKDTVLRSRKAEGRNERPVPGGEEVFPKEEVTRWESGIHAYGFDKLTEYIQTLMEWPVRQE